MTEQELSEIEARAKAATEGLWRHVAYPDRTDIVGPRERFVSGPASAQILRDAAFIAHARTDVPRLLEEVRRLREALGRLAGAVDAARHDLGTNYPTISEALILAFSAMANKTPPAQCQRGETVVGHGLRKG